MENIAKSWYEKTRTLSAFTVTGYTHKAANQFAKWYEFTDGSRLTVFVRGAIQWHEGWVAISPSHPRRLPIAIRTLWDARGRAVA